MAVKKPMLPPRFELIPPPEPTGVCIPAGYGLLSVAYGVTKLSLVATRVVVWLKPVAGPVRNAPMLLLKMPNPPRNTVLLWNAAGAQEMPIRGLGKKAGRE